VPGGVVSAFAVCAAGVFACSSPPPESDTPVDPGGSSSVAGSAGSDGGAGAQAAAGGTGGTPVAAGAGGTDVAGGAGTASGGGSGGGAGTQSGFVTHLPARIRRLANAEFDASLHALLATAQRPASAPDFPPDLRQDGFTVNDAQRVDAVVIERLASAADALTLEAQANGTLALLAPCSEAEAPPSCAQNFVTSFGAKVYRRPLVAEEVSALLELYAVGAEGATYADGVAHVMRGLLQSAGFLYLTELGDGTPSTDGTITLTPHELAATISYFLTSAPPDDELSQAAESGALSDPAEREAQARRLFATAPRAQDTVVRLVREWLGIDGVQDSAKDSLVYPEFANEKPRIVAESTDFVRAVAFESTGTIAELLGATWTVNTGPLSLYQTAEAGPIDGTASLQGRVGILNQAAFLATYANAHESHPIFRGVALARRVACVGLDSPASFNLQVVPPEPDPTKTTRERFSVHPADSICAGCHDLIDPLGFAFEHFDGMGRYRDEENGKPVDSSVEVAVLSEFDGPYADSNELAVALSESATVRECFARFMFRAAVASGDSAATPGEREFIEIWRALPAAAQGNIVETLIAYVKTPDFQLRGAQ
jgi:hypothetical protein